MSETWWRVSACRIEPVKVLKETAKTITVIDRWATEGRRVAKESFAESYYPAFDLAKAAMVQDARARLDRAKRELDRARSSLANAERASPPKEQGYTE